VPKLTPEIRAAWKDSLGDWCLEYLQAKPAAVRHGVDPALLQRVESTLADEAPAPQEVSWATDAIIALMRFKRGEIDAVQRQIVAL